MILARLFSDCGSNNIRRRWRCGGSRRCLSHGMRKTRGCIYAGGDYFIELTWPADLDFASSDDARWRYMSSGYCRLHVARRLGSFCRKAVKEICGNRVLAEIAAPMARRSSHRRLGRYCKRRRGAMRIERADRPRPDSHRRLGACELGAGSPLWPKAADFG